MTAKARFSSSYGWVKPGETYPFDIQYDAGPSGATAASVSVVLPPSAVLLSAVPAPTSGNGSAGSPLLFNLGVLAPGTKGKIVIRARAMTLIEDPEVIWKDLSATATLNATVLAVPQSPQQTITRGPRVTTLTSARYGDRPFPVVMVQYQDIKHCTGVGTPFSECTGDHTSAALDAAVNSPTSGKSLWKLYQEMSFGQLNPQGSVNPAPGKPDETFVPTSGYPYKWSKIQPSGTCTGTTLAPPTGTGAPLYPTRIENGWYQLPGTQGYYGSDKTGHALAGALTGQGLLFGIDDACGPTAKIVYDAAALADPDIDYNEFDTDKDGVVDFFNLMFAGDGGNGSTTPTGINNVWPHKSDVRFYFTDANGESGYVSNDQLKNHDDQLMYWTDTSRTVMTAAVTAYPVYVRVGPYNVNPESAVDQMSVIAHEYGHSLGLPDYYSLGSRGTFGAWELMASDFAQFMTIFNRQELGWIVPVEATDSVVTLKESKVDTHSILWNRPDGTPYTLTGPGVHNGDALRVGLPRVKLIDQVPSGTRAFHSGAGNDFGCPGHYMDIFLPEMAQSQNASATSVSLTFKSWYEMEWDFDYGFVLASTDGGNSWTSLASSNGTTIQTYNPNQNACFTTYSNGITGSSASANTVANPDRQNATYPAPVFKDDQFDLTPFKGQSLLLRFAYATDPGLAKRGWFIDDIKISADARTVYASDFETLEADKIFTKGWARISTDDGVETDHAYYVELRDRVSWDWDSKGQSARGPITWSPGVAVLYTDENHGYGNVGVDDPPAQTIVDSQPQPGETAPNLDDAAYTAAVSDDKFDACNHIDNYSDPAGPGGLWKLPEGVSLTVTQLTGLVTDTSASRPQSSPATATLVVDVNPNCSLIIAPPVLDFLAAGHQDPDTDGSYTLTWTRPAGAVGPDTLQEATVLASLLTDGAESGLAKWTVSSNGTVAFPWQQSTDKVHNGTYAFLAKTSDGVTDATTTMTLNTPVALPAVGAVELSFWDWFINEGDDSVLLEVSSDGVKWDSIYNTARSALAPDEATAFATEPLSEHRIDLSAYAGKSVRLRFTFIAGSENRAGSTPFGWYVDDVLIETSNWADIANTASTSSLRSGRTNGTYYYRVSTKYPSGPVTLSGPWSNVVSTGVVLPIPAFDPNGDHVIDPADIFYLVNFLFANGPACVGSGDANGDAVVDPADIFYAVNYVFAGGPLPK